MNAGIHYQMKSQQKAQLSQRDRAMLCVIEYFARLSHSRSFEMVPFESFGTVSYSPSIDYSNYGSILYHFRDKARYSIFHTPAFGVPVKYWHTVWYGKTSMVWLTDGEKVWGCVIAVSTEYRRATYRRTSRDSIVIVRAMHTIER